MAKLANISVVYDYGNCWWVVSDSSNEFEDFKTMDAAEVELTVSWWRKYLQQMGHDVKVHYPPNWPPSDEEIEKALDEFIKE